MTEATTEATLEYHREQARKRQQRHRDRTRALRQGVTLASVHDATAAAMTTLPASQVVTALPQTDEAKRQGIHGVLATCPIHQRQYPRTYVASLDCWTGQCDACKAKDELEQRAQAVLATRSAEVRSRIERLLPDYEAQVQEQAERDVQAHVEEVTPQFLADVRHRLWEQLEFQVEAELKAEIIAEFQGVQPNDH